MIDTTKKCSRFAIKALRPAPIPPIKFFVVDKMRGQEVKKVIKAERKARWYYYRRERIARCCSVVEELYALLSSAHFEVGSCLLWWNNSSH